MPSEIVHSTKVPRLFKIAAKIVREVRENHGSLKSLIFEGKHPNVSALYSLCHKTLAKERQLDYLLKKTSILVNEPRLDPWLARILVTELLWGKKNLKAKCKPIQTVLAYKQKFWEELNNVDDVELPQKPVKKPRYVRINTLLLPLEKGISHFQKEGWCLMPKCSKYTIYLNAVMTLKEPNFIQDFHIPELLVFPPGTIFYHHAKYKSGEIILQDKASCLPSQLLNPARKSVVLDLCAAPGMKTSHLAAIMENTGKIYAVDVDKRRYEMLCKKIELTGASCVETVNKDALALMPDEYPNVEYILVDPSCSGSGMLDRQKAFGKEKYDRQRLKRLQGFQVFILRHALLNFPNVKRVVYSTCSTHSEENEQVVDEILENVQNAYKLLPATELLDHDWLNFSSKIYNCSDKCLYAKSDMDLCNDFFIAVFERNFDVPLPEYKGRKQIQQVQQVASNNQGKEEIEVDRKQVQQVQQVASNNQGKEEIEVDMKQVQQVQQVASNNQGKEEIEVVRAENSNTTEKPEKLRKRKNTNEESSQTEETNDSILIDSVLNASSDSIQFVQEVKNDDDDDPLSQNNDSVIEDTQPVIKKRKKKISSMIMKLPRNRYRLSLHKEFKLQKKKRKIL